MHMIDFLKKYRVNIILLLVLTGLMLYFIPTEQSRYLQPDIDTIESKSHSVLLWTEMILFAILFTFGRRQLKKFPDFIFLVVGLSCLALTLFFVFDSIFLSTTFLLNRLSKNQKVYKKYKVVYVDSNNKNLLLWDDSLKKGIRADQLIKKIDSRDIKVTGTIIVSFTKGLLGFNFDPKIKNTR